MSHHFGETLRAAPGDVEVRSHQLLLRAAYVRQLAAGIFSYLPLGHRSMAKIERIIREEMDAIGGQEITMPVVHPAEVWQETGRWYQIGDEMARFKDRAERDMVLAMTHEEVVADLVRKEIRSYRQLPALVYQLQTKFRDEPRPRAGLIRVREFTMKDSYSLDIDAAGLEEQYRRHYTAYFRIFSRCGLKDVVAVKSDTGMMGGKLAHEFMFLCDIGEDTLALCPACGYSANLQVARFRKPEAVVEEAQPVEKVETPNTPSIEALAELLQVPQSRTAKAVFFTAAVPAPTDEEPEGTREVLVMAIVRGDLQVNETKLSNAIKARWLRPATDPEIRAVGAVPGYASPIGIDRSASLVVLDDLAAQSTNLVAGANETGYHLRNVNAGRDFQADVTADLTSAYEGAPCFRCGQGLTLARGVEVGNIFQLGTRYTEALGATFLDAEGQARPVVMGSYGIGVGRLLACLGEAFNDEYGLQLPITVAPYELFFASLPGGDEAVAAQGEELYAALKGAGVEVLFDDRDVKAGVKFADADLIGIPLRLTLSSRSLKNGGVELKRRDSKEGRIVPLEEALAAVREEIARLYAEEAEKVVSPPYPEAEAE
ncbi:MAG: proline--tRNA ligase [Armatimonadota bacterium]